MQRFSMLQYDVRDDAVFTDGTPIPNPSGVFRRFMVRTSFSVWVVPDDRIPYGLLDRWTESKMVRWWIVPFAAEGTEAVLRMCRDALTAEIAKNQQSVDESLAQAAAKADKLVEDGGSRFAAERQYESAVNRITGRMTRILEDLEQAARLFGLRDLPFSGANAAIATMGASAHTRLALHKQLATRVASDLGEQAAKDMPPEIIADHLEEKGEDVSAVREVLASPPLKDERQATGSATYTTQPPVSALESSVEVALATITVPVSPAETPDPRPVITRTVAHGNGNGHQPRPDCCPRCGAGLTAPKRGRFGMFRGCTRFPACRGLVNA